MMNWAFDLSPQVAPVAPVAATARRPRSEEHTSELQSRQYLVCRLLLEKKKKNVPSAHCTEINRSSQPPAWSSPTFDAAAAPHSATRTENHILSAIGQRNASAYAPPNPS